MATYELSFPDYLDGYEFETESKGYLVGVRITAIGRTFELTIYDEVRLLQEVRDEVSASGYFSAPNLVVVPKVTREAIEEAVYKLSMIKFQGLLPGA